MTTTTELMSDLDAGTPVYRYGDPDHAKSVSMSQGRVWSDSEITIGVCPEHKLRELHFVADSDVLVFLKPGYSCERSVNKDRVVSCTLSPNEMYWLPTGTDFYSKAHDAKETIFINFHSSIRRRFDEAMPFKTSLDEPVVPVRDITRHSVFSTLIQAFIESDGMGGRMRAEALIDLVLHDICVQLESRNLQMNTNTISRPVLKKVQDFVEVNLADEIKIDDLAEIADMSVFHFSRMFRNSKGMAPYQFVTQRRIAKAQHLLATTADDIACIANATGFSSQSHLTSTFKKLIGMTPRNFRLSQ